MLRHQFDDVVARRGRRNEDRNMVGQRKEISSPGQLLDGPIRPSSLLQRRAANRWGEFCPK